MSISSLSLVRGVWASRKVFWNEKQNELNFNSKNWTRFTKTKISAWLSNKDIETTFVMTYVCFSLSKTINQEQKQWGCSNWVFELTTNRLCVEDVKTIEYFHTSAQDRDELNKLEIGRQRQEKLAEQLIDKFCKNNPLFKR